MKYALKRLLIIWRESVVLWFLNETTVIVEVQSNVEHETHVYTSSAHLEIVFFLFSANKVL